jgi:D-alanine-D-alanine ligase
MKVEKRFTVGLVFGGNDVENISNRQAVKDIRRVLERYSIGILEFNLNHGVKPSHIGKVGTFFVIDSNISDYNARDEFFESVTQKGIPCIGQNRRAFMVARNKDATSAALLKKGLSVSPRLFLKSKGSAELIELRQFVKRHGFPVVIKDNFGSSSENVLVAMSMAEVESALQHVMSDCGQALIEAYAKGVELTVLCVTLCGQKVSLMPIEIEYDRLIYDFKVKNKTMRNKLYLPPRLPKKTIDAARDCANKADRAVGCKSYSRTDMKVTIEGTTCIIEVNGEPVLSRNDFMARSAKHLGLSYGRLIIGLMSNSEPFLAYARANNPVLFRYIESTESLVRGLECECAPGTPQSRF